LRSWSSSHVSLPVASYGRVSMVHPELSFFWADMSIYPGNSGGPVVEADKLVGIVSGQPVIPVEGDQTLRTRIPFARITKASGLHDLLAALA
jgi:S1-C subfamily serine protease